jgi:hypothetical protein
MRILSNGVNPLGPVAHFITDLRRRLRYLTREDFYLTPKFFYVYISHFLVFLEKFCLPLQNSAFRERYSDSRL